MNYFHGRLIKTSMKNIEKYVSICIDDFLLYDSTLTNGHFQ